MRATAETSVMADIYRGDRFPNLSIAPMKILISSVLSVTVCSAENAVHPAREMKIAGMSFSVITRVARDAYDLNLGIGEPGGNKGRPFRLVFAIQDAENHYEFALGQKRQVLLKRVNGKETILAEAGRLLFALVEGSEGRSDKALGGGLPVTVKRRSSWLSVFVGGEMVLSAMDSTFAGGGVAAANAGAERLLSFRLQPVEPVEFSDDFMRTERASVRGPWSKVSGKWELLSRADQWRAHSPIAEENATRSANPFVYRGQSGGRATAIAGHGFWDDYTFAASVRSVDGSPGLAVHYRGDENYFLFRLRPAEKPGDAGAAEIIRVNATGEEILASTGIVARSGVWYRVSLATLNGELRVALDGLPILSVKSPKLSGGRIGLCVEGGEADFDDVRVRSTDTRIFDDAASFGGPASGALSDWRFREEDGATVLVAPENKESLFLFGDPKWKNYHFDLNLQREAKDGSAGMVFGARSADDYFRLRWAANGELALEKVGNSKLKVLSAASHPFKRNRRFHLRLDLTHDGVVSAYIDGRLELRAAGVAVPPGKLGLYADGGGITFTPPAMRSSWDEDLEKVIENETFQKDSYMVEWAAARGVWLDLGLSQNNGKRLYLHKGDFYGPFTVQWAAGETFTLLFGGTDENPRAGYKLDVTPAAATFSDDSRQLGKAGFTPADKPSTVTLHRDGKYVWLEQDGRELIVVRCKTNGPGTRLGATVDGAKAPTYLEVRRRDVADYPFDRAAVDWEPAGRWEVSNKFACDPRWGFMAGEADGLASLWHKANFEGDLTVEFFAAMRYLHKNLGLQPYYPRPGEINLTVGGNGKDVFSGYTFVLSGWDTRWTRILRNGKVVAETDRPLVPPTRLKFPSLDDLHRRWFYVKLRKQGNRLSYYFDNQLVLSYADPKPLKGERLALWTRDNSIILARAKLSYEKKRLRPVLAALPEEKASRPLALRIESESHPGILSSFEDSLDSWSNPSGDQGAFLERDETTAGRGKASLKLTNVHSGGDFAARLPSGKTDLANVVEFGFDYRIPKGVMVNFYFDLFEKRHFIELTAGGESTENMKRIGAIAVRSDGRWHRAEFPLSRALREIYPDRAELIAENMTFGNLHAGYLHAGLGGNLAGAFFHLDNFRIISSGGEPRFFIAAADGQPLDLAYGIDARPDTAPGTRPLTTPWLHEKDLAPGRWYLHAQGQNADGERTAPSHLCFEVDTASLSIDRIVPRPKGDWGGETIVIRFSPEKATRLDLENTSLLAGNVRHGMESPAVSYEHGASELRFDVRESELQFEDGETVSLRLSAGRTGMKEMLDHTWQYRWKFSRDKSGPAAPATEDYFIHDTFERDLGEWTRGGPDRSGRQRDALLVRDNTTAAGGRYCLKLFNDLMGGTFGATVTTRKFHAGRYPLLLFDYLVDRNDILFDLGVWSNEKHRRVTITDNDHRNSLDAIGAVSGVRADGRWCPARVHLRRMLDTQDYLAGMHGVTRLAFGDWGWTGNQEGAKYRIDNFRLIPAINPKEGCWVRWRATDPSGIKGYSYSWSEGPTGKPDKTIDCVEPAARFSTRSGTMPKGLLAALNKGTQELFFHVRAQDRAGNWGETGHHLYLIDAKSPTMGRPTPKPDTRSGSARFSVRITDDVSGVDPDSLWFTINGHFYRPGSDGVTYTPATGELSWDFREAPEFRTIGSGEPKKFTVRMKAPSDFAGNVSEPREWSWTFDPALDRKPAFVASLNSPSQVKWTYESFSDELGKLEQWGSGTRLKRVWDDDKKDYCARATCNAEAAGYGLRLAHDYDTSIYPYVDFDYKFPPNLKLQLSAYVKHEDPERRRLIIKIAETRIRPDYVVRIGEVPGVKLDNQWHHLSLNLHELIEANEPELTGYRVQHLLLQDPAWHWHEAGTALYLDNLCISGPGESKANFTWQAIDESGIRDYAFSMDKHPSTQPGTGKTTDQDLATLDDISPGRWFFHLRTRDNAGNWSPALHYPYWVPGSSSD